MAFVIEWSNPIFYLNLGGLACSLYLWTWARGRTFDLPLKAFFMIMTIGSGLHFIGDLFEFPETGNGNINDHVLIHATVLVAFAVLAFGAFGNRDG